MLCVCIKQHSHQWIKIVKRSIELSILGTVLGSFLVVSSQVFADRIPGEYDVKLAFLYNFTKFIDWPEQAFQSAQSPFSICIMGKLPSQQTVKHITSRTAKNRPISIHFLHYNHPTDNCHVLFLTRTVKRTQIQQVTNKLTTGTLLVGEVSGFARRNGVVEFLLDSKNRVRIEINLTRARQHNMDISAQLLEVAEKVYQSDESNS